MTNQASLTARHQVGVRFASQRCRRPPPSSVPRRSATGPQPHHTRSAALRLLAQRCCDASRNSPGSLTRNVIYYQLKSNRWTVSPSNTTKGGVHHEEFNTAHPLRRVRSCISWIQLQTDQLAPADKVRIVRPQVTRTAGAPRRRGRNIMKVAFRLLRHAGSIFTSIGFKFRLTN